MSNGKISSLQPSWSASQWSLVKCRGSLLSRISHTNVHISHELGRSERDGENEFLGDHGEVVAMKCTTLVWSVFLQLTNCQPSTCQMIRPFPQYTRSAYHVDVPANIHGVFPCCCARVEKPRKQFRGLLRQPLSPDFPIPKRRFSI